jgi:phospholipid-binding lipoprotein MlaA
MRKSLSILAAAAMPVFALNAESPRESDVVIITKDGIKSAPLRGGKIPKNSNETLFLRSAVEKVTPKTSPTRITPEKKPAKFVKPKPASSPAMPVSKPSEKPAKNARVAEKPQQRQTVPAPVASSSEADPNITIRKKAPVRIEDDDLEEYTDAATIADPAEVLNRGTFWLNHQIYNYVLRPFSKAYEFVIPTPARTAIHNVFDNVEYPVRVVNHTLQFEFKRADLETRKFLVNSVAGVGGILRVSDRIPELANVPPADTGQTLAKWGIDHGAYVVLPVLGPRSLRDTVGMAGDYALNPVSWLAYGGVGGATALAVTGPNAARNFHTRLKVYDAATENALDPYLAVRSGYIQYRAKAASK